METRSNTIFPRKSGKAWIRFSIKPRTRPWWSGFINQRRFRRIRNEKKRLEKIINTFNPTRHPKDGPFWKKRFCWPQAIVEGSRLGFVAPRISDEFFFEQTKKEKKCLWFTNPRLASRLEEKDKGTLRHRLMTCRNLAQAVGRLHHTGLAHSDLSGNNVLLDPRQSWLFVD